MAMRLFDQASFLESVKLLQWVSIGGSIPIRDISLVDGLFWFVYLVVTKLIVAGIFPAVICEQLHRHESVTREFQVISLKRNDIRNFFRTWAKLNPNGSHYMKTVYIFGFLTELP